MHQATKEGTLRGAQMDIAGVGPVTRDLQSLYAADLRLLVGVTVLLIFAVVAGMLRSPVAALVVVGTVAVSYAAALGVAVLIWQDLAGHDLHWAVPAVLLIALIAVGLLVDTLLIRTFVMPATAMLLGRWFWWPHVGLPTRRDRSML